MHVKLHDVRGWHQEHVGTADEIAERLQQLYPEGTPISTWPGAKAGPCRRRKVRAWGMLQQHTFGVWCDVGGFIAITHVEVDQFSSEPLPAAAIEEGV